MINGQTPLEDVLEIPGAIRVFEKYGIKCLGWMGLRFETIEQGARAHNVDLEKLLNDLRQLQGNKG